MVQKKSKIVVFGEPSIEFENAAFVNESDFFGPPRDYSSEVLGISAINQLENKKINDLAAIESLMYRDVSIWWYFKPAIRRGCGIYINFIKRFSEFLENEKPDLLIIKKFENFNIIKEICERQKVRIDFSEKDFQKFVLDERIDTKRRFEKRNETIKKLIKKRKEIFFKKYDKIPHLENKLLFVLASTFRRWIIDKNSKKTVRGEFIVHELLSLLKNRKAVIMDYSSNFFDTEKSDEILEERLNSEIPCFPIEALFPDSQSRLEHEKFMKNFHSLLKSEKFQKLFQFNGISYWDRIYKRFENISNTFLPYWLLSIDSIFELFQKQKPTTIFLLAEIAPIPSIVIAVGKKFKIKTVGVQHGIIFDYEPSYSNDKFANLRNPSWLPIPDKMLVFGEIPKKILIEKGYPPEKIDVLGNPEFFQLDKIKNFLNEENLAKSYKIQENQKVILFFSSGWQNYYQPVGKYEFDLFIWKNLLENFSKNKNIVIVLKPHPMERLLPYKQMVEKYQPKNFRILDKNILELIQLSSVVVSTFSTTVIDSLCFEKPVIQVTFENTEFKNPFDDFRPIIYTDFKKLSITISDVLDGKIYNEDIIKRGKIFLKKYYNIPEENPDLILKNLLE